MVREKRELRNLWWTTGVMWANDFFVNFGVCNIQRESELDKDQREESIFLALLLMQMTTLAINAYSNNLENKN